MSPHREFVRARWILVVVLLSANAPATHGDEPLSARAIQPLPQAHAHNDYNHQRPLQDALEQGFCSIEADVFLRNGALLVGHAANELRPERTLEKLYLAPLRERVRANGGSVYPKGPTLWLLIDIKSDGPATYAAIDSLLARYGDILSVTRDGTFEPKAITVVISGNCPRDVIRGQTVRYAGIDGRPEDLSSTEPAHLMPWISANWTLLFQWRGEGPLPEAQRMKLQRYVEEAHQHQRVVRFWATPERPELWQELLDARVDLIGTDRLAELATFLRSAK